MAGMTENLGDISELLPDLIRMIRGRIEFLAEIQKVELKTKEINRAAAFERLSLIEVIRKLYVDAYSSPLGLPARGVRPSGKAQFGNDLGAFLKGMK